MSRLVCLDHLLCFYLNRSRRDYYDYAIADPLGSQPSLEEKGSCDDHVLGRNLRHRMQRPATSSPLGNETYHGPIVYVPYQDLLHLKLTIVSDDQAPVALWSYLEQAVGIICGCLPAFRSLIGHMFPKLKLSQGGSGDDGSKSASYGSATRTFRSGETNHKPDIELIKRGTSEEQIVYMGNRSSEEFGSTASASANKMGARNNWRRC